MYRNKECFDYYVFAHYCSQCTRFVHIGFTNKFAVMWQSKIETNNFQVYQISEGLTREGAVTMVKQLRKDLNL